MAANKQPPIRPSSRLTSKNQVTMPSAVRKRLNLKPGDMVIFKKLAPGAIRIRKTERLDLELVSALQDTLSEWNTDDDDCAYQDL